MTGTGTGTVLLYASVCGYALLLAVQLVRGGGGRGGGRGAFELGAQGALALLLGLSLHALGQAPPGLRQLQASSAALAIAASLVIFAFGASVGRQWTLAAAAAAATAKKHRGKGKEDSALSTTNNAPTTPNATTPTPSTPMEVSREVRQARADSETHSTAGGGGAPSEHLRERAHSALARPRMWSEDVSVGGRGGGGGGGGGPGAGTRSPPARLLSRCCSPPRTRASTSRRTRASASPAPSWTRRWTR
jgi:hypothetical protein